MFIMVSAIYSLLSPLVGHCIIICFASHFESYFNSLCIVMNLLNLHVFLVLRNGVTFLEFSDFEYDLLLRTTQNPSIVSQEFHAFYKWLNIINVLFANFSSILSHIVFSSGRVCCSFEFPVLSSF